MCASICGVREWTARYDSSAYIVSYHDAHRSLPLVPYLEHLCPLSVLLHKDTKPVGVVSVAHESGADVAGLAIGMKEVEILVDGLAIRIGSRGANGHVTFRIRVVKRDGLGDGIIGVETVVVRLAVEVGIELDGGVVRRQADL